jgi:glucokinase
MATNAPLELPFEMVAADIGGTNARFAIARIESDGRITLGAPKIYSSRDHTDLGSAWARFEQDMGNALPRAAAFGLPCPIEGDVLRFANSPWYINRAGIKAELGLDHLSLVNDFGAMAYAVDRLGADHFTNLAGPETDLPKIGTITVIGPGTGLGVAQLVRTANGPMVLETEGAHQDFAPLDPVEDRILADLRQKLVRVSIERLVSGPGLNAIYEALARISGSSYQPLSDADLWARALAGDDRTSHSALERFCLMFGAAAGDAALAHGSMGVAIVGGLSNRAADVLRKSGFHARFTAKGRFSSRMEKIPVQLVTHPYPGLLGAAASFQHRLEP